jgi:hypothetical protein
MHLLLDVSMPGFCTLQQTHPARGILYSLPSDDWHWKECDSRHLHCPPSPFACLRISTRPLSHDLPSLLGTPHSIYLVIVLLGSERILSPVSQLAACVSFSRYLLFTIQTRRPLCAQTSRYDRASATIFVNHLLVVRLSGKHITSTF